MTATLDILGPFDVLTRPLRFQPADSAPTSGADRAGPVAWWSFDEEAGTAVTDATGSGFHGKLHGPPRWSPGQGARGGALEFNGADNWIECDPAWESHARDGLTVMGWFKARGTDPGIQTLIAKSESWWLQRDGTENTVTFGLNGPQTTGTNRGRAASVRLPRSLDEGQWHHVAGVYDGQRIVLYLDGKEEAAITAAGPLALSTASVTLGDDTVSRGRWFNGWMDDVRIYHRGLSSEEIQSLYCEVAK